MSKLLDLTKALGQDAELASEYERDPQAVMARYELSDSECKALADGDVEAVKRLTGVSDCRKTNSVIRTYD